MSSRRQLLDAIRMTVWPGTRFLLHPSGSRHTIAFVRAVADARLWPAGAKVHIGRSVLDALHPVAVAAIAHICARYTGKPVQEAAELAEKDSLGATHLADWLFACASGKAGGVPSEKQTSYLFASGAHRARAINSMLRSIHKTPAHMVDIGTGVGLIPWLLCTENAAIRSAELFEPDRRRRTALDILWSDRAPHQTVTVAHRRAEDVQFSAPVDLVMFCQCFFRIRKSERGGVLERAWQALEPGGVLLVNEMPKEAAGGDPLRDALLTHEEIVSLMPQRPLLFTSHTGWRTAQDPRAISASRLGASALFVAIRPD